VFFPPGLTAYQQCVGSGWSVALLVPSHARPRVKHGRVCPTVVSQICSSNFAEYSSRRSLSINLSCSILIDDCTCFNRSWIEAIFFIFSFFCSRNEAKSVSHFSIRPARAFFFFDSLLTSFSLFNCLVPDENYWCVSAQTWKQIWSAHKWNLFRGLLVFIRYYRVIGWFTSLMRTHARAIIFFLLQIVLTQTQC